MLKVLFLDDDRQRHAHFVLDHRGEYTIVQTWCFADAAHALSTNSTFDIAFLDHDLEQTHTSMERCKNGVDVAEFIVGLPAHLRPKRVVIHSWNEIGRLHMKKIFDKAGIPSEIRPFGGI